MILTEYAALQLKKLRISKKMSQEELAEKLTECKNKREKILIDKGVTKKNNNLLITRATISKYELGKIRMNQDVLFDFCNIFNVPIDYFFPTIETAVEKIEETFPFTKELKINDDLTVQIKTDKPFEKYSLEEQQQKINEVMDKLYEEKLIIKNESKKDC